MGYKLKPKGEWTKLLKGNAIILTFLITCGIKSLNLCYLYTAIPSGAAGVRPGVQPWTVQQCGSSVRLSLYLAPCPRPRWAVAPVWRDGGGQCTGSACRCRVGPPLLSHFQYEAASRCDGALGPGLHYKAVPAQPPGLRHQRVSHPTNSLTVIIIWRWIVLF